MPRGVYPRSNYHKQAIARGKDNSYYRHSEDTKKKIGLGVKSSKLLKDLAYSNKEGCAKECKHG